MLRVRNRFEKLNKSVLRFPKINIKENYQELFSALRSGTNKQNICTKKETIKDNRFFFKVAKSIFKDEHEKIAKEKVIEKLLEYGKTNELILLVYLSSDCSYLMS